MNEAQASALELLKVLNDLGSFDDPKTGPGPETDGALIGGSAAAPALRIANKDEAVKAVNMLLDGSAIDTLRSVREPLFALRDYLQSLDDAPQQQRKFMR